MSNKKTKAKMTKAEKREATWAWAFIAPTMLGLIILNFYPVVNTIYQSFCKTGDFGKGNTLSICLSILLFLVISNLQGTPMILRI